MALVYRFTRDSDGFLAGDLLVADGTAEFTIIRHLPANFSRVLEYLEAAILDVVSDPVTVAEAQAFLNLPSFQRTARRWLALLP